MSVVWSRNNHSPVGFSRLALVPLRQGKSVAAHKRYAFWWGCWGSGEVRCKGNKQFCDDDRGDRAYSRRVKVPTVQPDGLYILGVGTFTSLFLSNRPSLFVGVWFC